MSGETVKVIVRCRPINSRELNLNCETVVSMTQGVSCHLLNPDEPNGAPKIFTFDGAYDVDSTTEQIYNDVGFPLVESVLEGYNGTVFAYGQTGCGKSFTMQGIQDPASQRGIIPRSFEHIFEVIQTSENMKFLVHASYLEIYNEEIRDLLGRDTKKKLDLKEHPEKGVYVNGLTQHSVHNTSECESLMDKGWSNRSTGATLMNADSSRSHSIFTIALEMMSTAGDSDSIRTGKLNLVDLAGSERQAKTGATGDRLKEATKINLSLSALGNVISALVDGKSKHIPYRDSKLTRLLQDSLGGNTKTLMIACLSPADNNYDETLSTVRYANRAKNIKNKPKINEDPKDAMLREYQEEIRQLREMLVSQGPQKTVMSVAPDENALEKEREKVRREYEDKMRRMKEDMLAERESNAQLQANMDMLKKKYEDELQNVNAKIIAEKQHSSFIQPKQHRDAQIEAVADDGTIIYNDVDVDRASPISGVKTQNAEMMTSMQEEALKRLKELEYQMVGGEKSQDKELKAKRTKRKKYMEKRKKILSEALKNVDDEDGLMLKVYDDIHEELKAKTELAKRQKQKIKAMENEVKDLTEEFQNERSDYLETIRKQDQQIKLIQSILERVQPTIRRDCNYSDLDSVKKEAVWDDEYMRWKVPDLTVVKTKLPPAGPSSTQAQPDLLSKYNNYSNNNSSLNNSLTNMNTFNNNMNNSFNTKQQPQDVSDRLQLQMGARNPSQTAPARLGMWDDEDEDKILKQKLQRAEQEDIAGSYFRPKRAKELLVKFKGDTGSFVEKAKKTLNPSNLNMSMGPSALGNALNLNSSFNNSQGSSYSSSWGSNISSTNHNMGSTFGGSGGALNNLGGNVMSNGWLGDNSLSNISPEMTVRRPNRLEALPSLDGRGKKKSRDVLHTLDLI